MRINNIENSGFVKTIIVFNDIIIFTISYIIAYLCETGVNLEMLLNSQKTKTILIFAAISTIPASLLAPPHFITRMARADKILKRTFKLTVWQIIITQAMIGLVYSTSNWLYLIPIEFIVALFLITSERICAYKILKNMREKGKNVRNVILIGHPRELMDIYNTLQDKSFGFNIKGIFTRKEIPENMKIKKLGERQAVIDYLKKHHEITDIYLLPDNDYINETENIYKFCEKNLIRFYVLPVFMDFLRKKMTIDHVGNTTLLSARMEPLQDLGNRALKRTFDILVSGLFLITLFPWIYIIAGILIKIQSPGPILFKQKRNGLDGKEFYCLKFRSMHVNKDADKIQATENDPRKFKWGDIMRRTNIDELPQFINVFLGDMSLVGPRPHMLLHTQEYSKIIENYMVRHWVKPGITGWAQVQGFRGETKTVQQMEERVKADIWYVENWSFFLDIRIMIKTVINTIRHNEKNAY